MSVNDILVQGAEPLFFLDYFACGKLDVDVAAAVIERHRAGLRAGGLRADRRRDRRDARHVSRRANTTSPASPSASSRRTRIIDGSRIAPGDVVLGLASSGAHSNGYSLIRRIVDDARRRPRHAVRRPTTLGDALLAPTRIYVKPVLALMRRCRCKGIAHITGGGLVENVPRMLPEGVQARLDRVALAAPADLRLAAGSTATSPTTRCTACSTAASAWCVVVAASDAERAIADARRGRRTRSSHRHDRRAAGGRSADGRRPDRADDRWRYPASPS